MSVTGRLLKSSVVIALVACATAVLPASAQAGTAVNGKTMANRKPFVPGPPGDVIDRSDPGHRQDRLIEFKLWIISRPGIDASGYIESVNDSAHLATTLLWHGDSPLQDSIAAEGKSRGIIEPFRATTR